MSKMDHVRARDVMSRDIMSFDKDSSIERIVTLMNKRAVTKFPVVDDGKLIGLVSDEEIVDKLGSIRTRTITPSSLHVSSIMKREFFSIDADEEIFRVMERAKSGGIGIFPVLEQGALAGVITKSDLLQFIDSETKLEDIMVSPVKSVSPEDRIVHARRIMVDNGIERLPVLKEGKVVGIVAAMDIALFLYEFRMRVDNKYQQARLDNLLVEHAMKRDVITADKTTSVKGAAKIMYEKGVGCLPIVNSLGKIEGIVTRTDLIKTMT
jgi:CBS domain-containing protein